MCERDGCSIFYVLTLTAIDYDNEGRDECLFEAGVLLTRLEQVFLPHGQVSGANLKL